MITEHRDALLPSDTINFRIKPYAFAGRVPTCLGRFRVLEELARGGMGVVVRAYDERLEREVALKILNHHGSRFAHEARVAARLHHPGIIAVYESGFLPDGRTYLTMPLLAGETLAAKLTRGDRLRWLPVFAVICRIVGHAHRQGVIHRDLKPANIMIGNDGAVTVMDWGIAAIVGELDDQASETGHWVFGTPAYMAPEQAQGRQGEDPACDIFGLGGILCEILTGEPPYLGMVEAAIASIARGNQTGLLKRLLEAQAASTLVDLACRCLAVDPQARPENAEQVAYEVERGQSRFRGERFGPLVIAGLAMAASALVGASAAWAIVAPASPPPPREIKSEEQPLSP